ncbi:UPF0496 protein 1-like [Dioscorea cayenensis subsp. rotundata]|uniref:UPF0496 protein 1-like n=1 Tax=Dioscorea cayennensis subsp. rotundata TaxID=55577 RepID=A0AB40BM54_DIOCR|nr:UPF0496 protein 1-like [Dioscorea cayenensis subsp. rotundata]
MDKSWMNKSRLSQEYVDGLERFLDFAFNNSSSDNKIDIPVGSSMEKMFLYRELLLETLLHLVLLVILRETTHPPDKMEFKDEVDPFTEKFKEEFKLVCERQQCILHDLLLHKQDLDQKLYEVKAWRKVWNIVYSAVFAAILISSIVLAAVAAPPAVTAAAAAASEERKIIDSLEKETSFAINELNGIRSLVDSLEGKIRTMIHRIEFTIDGKEEQDRADSRHD